MAAPDVMNRVLIFIVRQIATLLDEMDADPLLSAEAAVWRLNARRILWNPERHDRARVEMLGNDSSDRESTMNV